MNILLLGPQGSGKGTVGSFLTEKLNLFYFEAGAMLRKIAETNKEIDEIVNKKGTFLDDDFMTSLVIKHLEENKVYDNIAFDGFPRSIRQYDLISQWLKENNQKIDIAIYLDVPEEVSIKRLSARRTHKVTGKVYNLITLPPGPEINPDDLVQREDDKESSIRERLKTYHEKTQPLIERLKEEKILSVVDATKQIDEVCASALEKTKGQ